MLVKKIRLFTFLVRQTPVRDTDREESTSFKEEERGKGVNIVL